MARLTSDQWADLRSEWEASPRQGLAWLVRKEGGRWDVTEEAVRQRRRAEGWTKRGTLGSVVEKAHLRADRLAGAARDPDQSEGELGGASLAPDSDPKFSAGETPGTAELGPSGTGAAGPEAAEGRAAEGGTTAGRAPTDAEDAEQSGKTEKSAVELRAELIERHRQEWKLARRRLYKADAEAARARGFDVAKFAKIMSETLTLIQAGERKAWGLDAAALPVEHMSDEELERIASGRMPV